MNKRGRLPASETQGIGVLTRPVSAHSWEVQAFTGYPVARVPEARWTRGALYRFATPAFRPSKRELFQYDPTDIATWNYAGR